MIFNFRNTQDAKTLGGHEAEYFERLGHKFTILDRASDMDTVPPFSAGIVYSNDENRPPQMVSGGYGLFYSIGHGDRHKIQRVLTPQGQIIERIYTGSKWYDWTQIATTTDLATELAKYLPLTGGVVDSLTVKYFATMMGSASDVTNVIQNSVRSVFQRIYADGSYRLYDSTNGKEIIHSTANGTTTFYGIASGSIASTASGGQQIKAPYGSPLSLNNITDSGTSVTLRYYLRGEHLGALGFNGVDSPMFLTKDGVHRNLHHDGNSAKVVISETAPSDTSALWVY